MLTKIWRLSPDQIASYKYAQDLGEPHEVKDVPVVVWPAELETASRIRRDRPTSRQLITAELYSERRAAGWSDQEIAELYGIKLSTLRGYKAKWRREAALCTMTLTV